MSYQNMTAAELRGLIVELGFPRVKGEGEAGRPSEGYTEVGIWLGSNRGGERIARYGREVNAVPPELAYLLRLMLATGYTPEMVEALPPVRPAKRTEPKKGQPRPLP